MVFLFLKINFILNTFHFFTFATFSLPAFLTCTCCPGYFYIQRAPCVIAGHPSYSTWAGNSHTDERLEWRELWQCEFHLDFDGQQQQFFLQSGKCHLIWSWPRSSPKTSTSSWCQSHFTKVCTYPECEVFTFSNFVQLFSSLCMRQCNLPSRSN